MKQVYYLWGMEKIKRNTPVMCSDDSVKWTRGIFVKKTTKMKGYSNVVMFPDGSTAGFKFVRLVNDLIV